MKCKRIIKKAYILKGRREASGKWLIGARIQNIGTLIFNCNNQYRTR